MSTLCKKAWVFACLISAGVGIIQSHSHGATDPLHWSAISLSQHRKYQHEARLYENGLLNAQAQFNTWWSGWASNHTHTHPDIVAMQDHLGSKARDLRYQIPFDLLSLDQWKANSAFRYAATNKLLPAEALFHAMSLLLDVPHQGRSDWIEDLASRYAVWPESFLSKLESLLSHHDTRIRVQSLSILKSHPALPETTLVFISNRDRQLPELVSLNEKKAQLESAIQFEEGHRKYVMNRLDQRGFQIGDQVTYDLQREHQKSLDRINDLSAKALKLEESIRERELIHQLLASIPQDPCMGVFEF